MTLLERKAIAIQQLLNTDEQQFERLERYMKKIESGRLLCQETVEEMREGVRRATQDYKEGKNYTSHEEMKANFIL